MIADAMFSAIGYGNARWTKSTEFANWREQIYPWLNFCHGLIFLFVERPEQMTDTRNSPPRPTQHARRFAHVRECQASALIEDYVEMISDLIEINGEARVADIAARMGVAQPTATKAVARLKRQGLATSRPYRGIFLTEEGKQLADRVRSRHRIVVQFLVALGVPEETAEIDGEGIEHHVSEHTLAAFKKFLGMPNRTE